MSKVEFALEALSSSSSIKEIEDALKKQAGVKTAEVLFQSNKTGIEYDENLVSVDTLQETIEKLGYLVKGHKLN